MKPSTVVKLGGSLLENSAMRHSALRAIAAAHEAGENIAVVHGGGKRIDASLARLGIPKRTAHGLRVTDTETLDVVIATLAGSVNKQIVSELTSFEVPAAGISGADGRTLIAGLHPPVDGVDLGHVGRIVAERPRLLMTLLGSGFLPVIASVAAGSDGRLLNVNADTAAASIAASLGATSLIFLTDVEGLLDGKGELIDSLTFHQAAELLGDMSVVTGGMRPKLQAALSAIERGVEHVVIAGPSRHASSLLEGVGGTHLVAA
ncbi:MAG TPA: acetylglutamate kinase [Thermoanaerobaculia bacterium]|nr:acetylglutamate kinase [Thermoanaerobaculia bacterium]